MPFSTNPDQEGPALSFACAPSFFSRVLGDLHRPGFADLLRIIEQSGGEVA